MTEYTIPLYDDMAAHIIIRPGTIQGTYASGILFDADASVLSETDSTLYMDCHYGIVYDVLYALMTASGLPERDWMDGIAGSVDALGLECHCDCEPGECSLCDDERAELESFSWLNA